VYLYIHIPFCQSKCIYCDFTVVLNKHAPTAGGHLAFKQALFEELDQRCAQLQENTIINGVYVGGGTPSLLVAEFYKTLFSRLGKYATIADDAEMTLEANPNAVVDAPDQYRKAGFNRVSIGVQSLNDIELKTLSRNHSAEEAMACVQAFADGGFTNISLDLMHGFPHQTEQSWQTTLDMALNLSSVKHLSFYGLQVEAATPMARLVHTPAYTMPTEDTCADLLAIADEAIEKAGWQRYEISNACQPGFHSRHNANYWQPWNETSGQYLALGPGSHGYLSSPGAHGYIQTDEGFVRYENAKDLATWQAQPVDSSVTEIEPDHHRLENAFIFGLRTIWGVPLGQLQQQFGEAAVNALVAPAMATFPDHLTIDDQNVLRLSPASWGIGNAILEAFVAN
jgi:oxygen-independent coproporphyrinogen-3 oxidase